MLNKFYTTCIVLVLVNYAYANKFINYLDEHCLSQDISLDMQCACMSEHFQNPNDTLGIYSKYLYAGYNCIKDIKQKKEYYSKFRKLQQNIEFKDYRYLYSLMDISSYYYNVEYNKDSIEKIYNIALESKFDNNTRSASEIYRIYGMYSYSLANSGNYYDAINIFSNFINTRYYKNLSYTDKARAHFNISEIYSTLQDEYNLEKCLKHINISLNILSKNQSKNNIEKLDLLGNILYSTARYHEYRSEYKKALEYFKEALNNYSLTNNTNLSLNTINALAETYYNLHDLTNSKLWLQKVDQYTTIDTPQRFIINTNLNLTKIAIADNDLNESSKYLNEIFKSNCNCSTDEFKFEDTKCLNHFHTIETLLLHSKLLPAQEKSEFLEKTYNYFHKYINQFDNLYTKIKNKEISSQLYNAMIENAITIGSIEELVSASDKLNYSIYLNELIDIQDHPKKLEESVNNISNRNDVDVLLFIRNNEELITISLNESNFQINNVQAYNTIEQLVKSYLDCITNKCDDWRNISKTLYEKLILPNDISKDNLIIIPQGILSKLPFESLINEENELMLANTNIQQQLSLTLLDNKRSNSSNLLDIISPDYSMNTLDHAAVEVDIIKSLYDLQFHGKQKLDFLDALQKEGILHFSGHSQASRNTGEGALLFGDSLNIKDNYLTNNELLDYTCNKNLIVLGSCESGTGELLESEGLISIGFTFLYQGASTFIGSLWNINDKSTQLILTDFYRFFNKGESIDEALRQAKLTYLEQADPEYQHPYYWAGFIAMGDMSPLFFPQRKWYYGGIGLLSLALLFFVYKKKTSPSRLAA